MGDIFKVKFLNFNITPTTIKHLMLLFLFVCGAFFVYMHSSLLHTSPYYHYYYNLSHNLVLNILYIFSYLYIIKIILNLINSSFQSNTVLWYKHLFANINNSCLIMG